VLTELRFKKPMENTAVASMQAEREGNGTRLTWKMEGRSAYPFNLMNFALDGILGDDIQESLVSLKRILEK